jgi:hypothetical protein
MCKGPFDVFASHSDKNKDAVRAHVEVWKAQGLKVFFDEEQAGTTRSLLAHIESALERSRQVVVFVTPASVASHWVRYEVELTQQSDLDARREPRLVPVFLEKTSLEEVWPAARARPILDLTDPRTRQQNFFQLLQRLGVATGRLADLQCPSVRESPPATASLETLQETLKAALPSGQARTLDNVRELVQLGYKVWERFAALRDESDIGRKLDEMLWGWHLRLDVLCKWIIANEDNHSEEERKRAIDSICINRGELKVFSFDGEPQRTLKRIIDSPLAQESVKEHARAWRDRIKRPPRKRA